MDKFNSEYCTVTYEEKYKAVMLAWKKFASYDNYRSPVSFALELVRAKEARIFVIDARNGFEDEKDDVKWGFEYFIPELSRAGCERVIMLMNDLGDIEGEMDMWTAEFKKYFAVSRVNSEKMLDKEISL